MGDLTAIAVKQAKRLKAGHTAANITFDQVIKVCDGATQKASCEWRESNKCDVQGLTGI